MASKKEERLDEIKDEFNKIQEEHKDLNISQYVGNSNSVSDNLPDLGEIQIYNYDSDIDDSTELASQIMDNLADMYLGDAPEILEHPYIKDKVKEDALVYAETIFLQKMTRKNFLTQLRQIDNGDNSARMHEVIGQTIGQIRENIKFSTTLKTELEKYYKEIRKDFNLNEIKNKNEEEDKKESTGKVIDSKDLNDMIDSKISDYIKNK